MYSGNLGFNTRCALLCKKSSAASDLLSGCAARRPLTPPHLRCSLPPAARLAFARRAAPHPLCGVSYRNLGWRCPGAARLATPGMAACLHTLPLEYTTNVGCQGKYQVSSAKCQVFFSMPKDHHKQPVVVVAVAGVAAEVAVDQKPRNAARVIFAIAT